MKAVEATSPLPARIYRAMIESAPDAIVVIDEHGRIVVVNGQLERVFGYERGEMLGQPLSILLPERLRERHAVHHLRYFTDPRVRPMGEGLELAGRRKDGTEFPVDISLSPIHVDGANFAMAAIRDITSRKQVEEAIASLNQTLERRARELEFANKELEAFSSSVAHDLRAPLRAVDGYSRTLLEDFGERLGPDAVFAIERVIAASDRMATLIDDLLKFSRVTRARIRRAPVNLGEVAREVGAELARADAGREVSFTVSTHATVEGDPRLLRVVLENLLGNAWKYTSRRDHAVIEFGEESRDGNPAWFVRDNGAGFDMAYADQLFGVFQRLHRSDEYPGTGIGLATVQRIIERHGGEIWADAEVDRGAIFHFTLGRD